jgi:pSer/pThr/pTyr-binding forkhead associated (FHA) protein/uncharacterized membrane protein HdeD (DUF308 family)
MYNKIDTKVCQQCGFQLTPDSYCSYCNKSFAPISNPPNFALPVNNSQWNLVCINGANVGASCVLKQNNLIGREPDNDICILDNLSSRHHAVIQQNQTGIYIQDLGSSNGTYVNNVRISNSVYLKAGDLINIGNTQFVLENKISSAQPTLKADNYLKVNPPMEVNQNIGYIPHPMPNIPINPPEVANKGFNFPIPPSVPLPAYAPMVPAGINRPPQMGNPQRKVAFTWLVISGLGILGITLPFLADMDMMSKGFGIVFLSFFATIIGIITSIVFFVRAKTLDKLLSGQDLIAYWTYDPNEWHQYTETEFQISKTEKVPLLILTSVICLVVGGVFAIADPKAGLVVFLVMLGLIALLSTIVFIIPRLHHSHNQSSVGYAYIGNSGIYLNGYFHNWNMLGGSLDNISILAEKIPLLAFTYSYPSRTGRQEETVRIPIPQGQMPMAENIIYRLSKQIMVC